MARPDRSTRAALLLRTTLGKMLRTGMSGAVAWAVPAAALPGAPTSTPIVSTGGALPALSTVGAVQTIKLNAPRTILQYNGFTIATGETVNFRFDQRSDLAVVHSTTAVQVDGTLNGFVGSGSTYGGNVWLLSAAGVFFGAGARVDVGGLLASTSIPDLTNGSPLLNPTNLAFDFGNGAGAVTVAGGARITGHGGTLAFIAPSVTTGKGAVIAGAAGSVGNTAVLYGAAQRYTVRFMQEAGNDLDLLDFEVPGLTAGTTATMPLQLAGTTAAGNVYVASVNRADAVRAVLDAQGDIGAVSAGLEGGTIVLTAGGGIAGRAAAPLFTDGLNRQNISASGAINGARDVTVTATGDISLPGTIVAGGSIRLRGVNVGAASLTAGQDIVVRGGDETGSTDSSGYGHYLAEGGQLQIAFASAGDDILGTTWNGDTEFGSVLLAGTGGDLAGDPLGTLDAAGDGHRLRLTTTGDSGDVYLGRDGEFRGGQSTPSFAFENPIDTLDLGTNGVASLDAVGAVGVTLLGNATIHDAIARGGLATFGVTGTIYVGDVTAVGGIGVQGNNAAVGTATTSLDGFGNGLIVVNGLHSASIADANAATDVLVVADNGNATVGVAHAGDDVIIRAYGGSASLTSASVGVFGGGNSDNSDQDANRFSFGEGGSITLFPGRSFDSGGNGRVVDVAASTSAFTPVFDLVPPVPVPGAGDVFLGLGTGTISGADHVFLAADHDIAVDLIGAPVIDAAFAGHDITAVADAIRINDVEAGGSASVTARTGNARVDHAATVLDLSVVAANGLAQMGEAHVGRDFRLSGKTVALGSLGGYDTPGNGYGYGYGSATPTRDITILASGGGFTYVDSLTATRDLTINVSGDLLVQQPDLELAAATLTAGDDVRLHGATVTVDTVNATGAGSDTEADGSNIVIGGGAVTVYQAESAHDIRVDSTGLVTLGTGFLAQAANDIAINAADIQYGTLIAGRDVALTATAGTVTVTGFSFGGLEVGRDLSIDVSGDLVAGGLDIVRDLTLVGATVTADSANAGRDVSVTARTGDASIGSASAKRDLSVIAALGLAAVGDARVGGNLLMTGRAVSLGSLDGYTAIGSGENGYGYGGNGYGGTFTPTRNATLTATAGNVFGGASLLVVNNVLVSATGDVALGNIEAGNDVIATAGGPLGLGTVSGGRDVILNGSTLAIGGIDAGRDLSLTTTASGVSVGDLTAVRDLTLDAFADLHAGNVGAGRDLVLAGANVTALNASAGGSVTGTARTGTLTLATATAGDDVRAGGVALALGQVTATGLGTDAAADGFNIVLTGGTVGATQLAAATDIAVTGTVAVTLGQAAAGRDVTVAGGTVGGALQLNGRDVSVTSGGAFTATAGLNASRDLHLTAGTTLDYATLTAARDLFLTAANVTGSSASATRDLTVMATLGITGDLFHAGRNLVLDPNQPIVGGTVSAGGNATLIGASIDVGTLTVGGTTFAQATAGGIRFDIFSGTGDAVLIATGKVDLGDVTAAGLRIVGGDLDVRSSLVASTLAVETPGNMIIGGTAAKGETGFRLAAADMARLRISGIANFYAGVTTAANEGQVAGGNLTIQDFGYDPANLPRLAFFADRSHVVDVAGHVAPSRNGGAVQIGDANLDGRFRPGSIYVSGGLGSAELVANCFGKIVGLASLSMFAVNDIIFGASNFRGVVQLTDAGAIDVAGAPGVPAGPADDRLFVVSARFNVDAGGKIVSQNTASNAGGYAGMFITGIGAAGQTVSVGNARAIDLSGSFVDGSNALRSGPTAAKGSELGPGGVNGAIFRFNGCIVGGGGCTGQPGANPSEALRVEAYQPPRPIDITDGPLTTVLIIDQQLDGLDVLTIDNDGKVIVIRKKPGEQE